MPGVSVQQQPAPPGRSRGAVAAAVVLGLALYAAGCSDSPVLSTGQRSETISRSTFTGVWPFTVDMGILGCIQPQSVTFAAQGTTYGVNSSALDTGSAPADPILAADPKRRDAKKTLRDVVTQGLALCNR